MDSEPTETFVRYALGLAGKERLDAGRGTQGGDAAAVRELMRLGAQGWPDRKTLWTRSLPAGCIPCLQGKGSNLCLTTLCNRDCFFCFNPKPRIDEMSVHGRKVASEAEIPEVLDGLGIRSLGLSGGEPLLDPDRVLRILRMLRGRFGGRLRIDLYTNGELLTADLLRELKEAGLDALRINLVAGGYRVEIARLARRFFEEVEVEIPAIPEHKNRLTTLIDELDDAGVPHLVLHELFCSAQNVDAMRRRGYRAKSDGLPPGLTWGGVAASERTALEVMLHAVKTTRQLSVYYCSTGTQQWIAERVTRPAAPA